MNCFEFHSVGQGLFYTGSLMHGTYHFVFDCGTENKQNYVNDCIDNYVKSFSYDKEKLDIDFVVISHLHKDHFSGLMHLLHKAQVKKIYLPYLGENKDFIRSTLALSIFQEQYDQGIEDNAQNNMRLYYFMCGLYGVDESRDFIRYRELVVYIRNDEKLNKNRDVVYSIEKFDVGYTNNPYWQFKLIQSRAYGEQLKLLYKKLNIFFDQFESRNLISIFLNNKSTLKELKVIYESVFGTGNALNLTSILLVHFPLYVNAVSICPYNDGLYRFKKFIKNHYYSHYCCDINDYFYNIVANDSVVSILTGDAKVDSIISSEINNIRGKRDNLILQVPHHGSKDNWDAILNNKIEAEIYVVPFGYGNRHKLPSSYTIDSLIKDSREFYCVNQKDKYLYFID
ncbi:MAG: MBL fold metallo-hydrolase [Clostridia bacterium]|nr:MBL fold metallo-hydrolase [Clostridia bacterium]